ncbi:MAG: hypothetical protein KBD78_16640 [Oligoflexales bacterium]|nr:hypothetical protein [Oligoflexales bacterium]
MRICKIGERSPPLDKRFQLLDFKPYSFIHRNRISSETLILIAEKYKSGCSLGQIAKLLGCSKCKVRSALRKAEVIIRPSVTQETNQRSLTSFKQNALPYYGFCYFEGLISKDPKEFPVLLKIHLMWSQGRNAHDVTKALNHAKILSRKGKSWSWAAVKNILNRFDDKKIILTKDGKYEFR